jgi:PAS domain S-box-containing protein
LLNIMKFLKNIRGVERIHFRNYAIFFLVLTLCTGTLIYVLVSGEHTISKIGDQATHTYDVINSAQQLPALVEGMVASQRGYIFTRNDKFLEKYHRKRERVSEIIATLSELTSDNQSQASRMDELRHHFNEFSIKLEQRAQTLTLTASSQIILDDVEEIDGLRDTIVSINNAILREEYGILNRRIDQIEEQKSKYFKILLGGICVTFLMLLVFNSFLFKIQRKRNRAEASLRDTEKRFALAVEGTRDGIFDWDIQTGEVFYSKQFFAMLGDDRGAFIGTTQELKNVLHPEDSASVWEYVERYLRGEFSEYSQEFRLRHKNGRWIWVQSRAKAIFDERNNPLRLVGAHTDITYMKDYQAQLESEKKAAESANRAKSDFLAHMSHEIRTPLTAISGIAEIFEKKHDNLDLKQRKLVKTLYSSTAALKDLISDILDFSKIESGELELDETSFKVGTLFEEIISMMSMRASEKNISFVFDYSGIKDIDFYGDKTRLRQIIVNLIGNAIKFTKEGGVTVKAYKQRRNGDELLVIDVTDTGIGIAPENFDLVFERFKQADATVSRKYGGTGLGLPISKNLVQLMGGNIVLNSEIGKGSIFSVSLPFIQKGAETAAENEPKPEKTLDIKWKLGSERENKILMVEDYEGNVIVIGHILSNMGCVYDVVRTGSEAIEFWAQNNYALILMDIQMPEMDGFAATKTIRALEKENDLPHIPIIGMTAHALMGDKDKCIAAGMDAYLPKPIVESDLKAQIMKYLNSKKKAA